MKGILFKPWKIKAIADSPLDKVWQTRRVMKPQPIASVSELKEHSQIKGYWIPYAADKRMVNNNAGSRKDDCGYYPRYQVGETVYIKEAYAHIGNEYRAGKVYAMVKYLNDLREIPFEGERHIQKWWNTGKPVGYMQNPRTMPAWAARYFIKITDVRAERLCEITNDDAVGEGCNLMVGETVGGGMGLASPRYAYKVLWDTINKPPYDWQNNCWVWRYEFQPTPPINQSSEGEGINE